MQTASVWDEKSGVLEVTYLQSMDMPNEELSLSVLFLWQMSKYSGQSASTHINVKCCQVKNCFHFPVFIGQLFCVHKTNIAIFVHLKNTKQVLFIFKFLSVYKRGNFLI